MIAEIIARITEISGGNEFMAAAISAWFLGILAFVCKDIPKRLFALLKKHLTTSFMVTSHNETYYMLMAWFMRNGYSDKLRRINLVNGRWGYGSSAVVKSVGIGAHIVWHKGIPMRISLDEKDSSATEVDKFSLHITVLGRSHKAIDRMVSEATAYYDTKDDTKTKVIIYDGKGGWMESTSQPIRGIDTVFMPSKDKAYVLNSIREFKSKEDWYINMGIPYHLGILLYGPPGTGKTSLIKAIAAELEYDVRILPAMALGKITDACQSMGDPEKQMLVIEDVDSSAAIHSRDKEEGESSGEMMMREMAQVSISDILNSIDGIVTAHGRVAIMTTNHIDALDEAFLRPGRIDIKVSMGYVTPEVFCQFISRFFSQDIDSSTIEIKSDNLTIAKMQQDALEGKTVGYFIDNYTVNNNANL